MSAVPSPALAHARGLRPLNYGSNCGARDEFAGEQYTPAGGSNAYGAQTSITVGNASDFCKESSEFVQVVGSGNGVVCNQGYITLGYHSYVPDGVTRVINSMQESTNCNLSHPYVTGSLTVGSSASFNMVYVYNSLGPYYVLKYKTGSTWTTWQSVPTNNLGWTINSVANTIFVGGYAGEHDDEIGAPNHLGAPSLTSSQWQNGTSWSAISWPQSPYVYPTLGSGAYPCYTAQYTTSPNFANWSFYSGTC